MNPYDNLLSPPTNKDIACARAAAASRISGRPHVAYTIAGTYWRWSRKKWFHISLMHHIAQSWYTYEDGKRIGGTVHAPIDYNAR